MNSTQRSFVYFARCGQYVKIGYSYNPEMRLASLRSQIKTGRGLLPADIDQTQPLELIHTIPGCRMRDERILHGLFHMHHVEGEWFRYDLAFQRHLAGLRYQTVLERQTYMRRLRLAIKKANARAAVRGLAA